MKMDYRQICKNEEISLLIEKGNEILHELGYTEHSRKHAMKVAETAGKILKELGYGKRLQRSQDICMTSETASIVMTMPKAGQSWLTRF